MSGLLGTSDGVLPSFLPCSPPISRKRSNFDSSFTHSSVCLSAGISVLCSRKFLNAEMRVLMLRQEVGMVSHRK